MKTLKSKLNEKGSATLMAVATMVVMGILGAATIEASSAGYSSTANEINATQATYVGQAGIEDASYKLSLGIDPTVTDKPFGAGTYSITTNPVSGVITVTSQVGAAVKTQSLTTSFSKDCITFDTSTAVVSGNELLNVTLVKTCNTEAVLNTMTIDWNWADCATEDNSNGSNCNNGNGNGAEGCSPSENGNDDENGGSSECAVDHGNAQVSYIYLAQTSFYNPGLNEGTPGGTGADAGESIDGLDYTLTTDATYEFSGADHSITFSTTPAASGVYTLTATFADGSTISSTFTALNTDDDENGSDCNNGNGNGAEGCSPSDNGNDDESGNSNSNSNSNGNSNGNGNRR